MLLNFKEIEKWSFFQDIDYRIYNSKHLYLKIGQYKYVNMETKKEYDIRKVNMALYDTDFGVYKTVKPKFILG